MAGMESSPTGRRRVRVSKCTESEASTFPDGTEIYDLPLNARHGVYEVIRRAQLLGWDDA